MEYRDPREVGSFGVEPGRTMSAADGIISPRRRINSVLGVEGFSSLAAAAESSAIDFKFPFVCEVDEVVIGAEGFDDQTLARWSLGIKLTMPRTGEQLARGEAGGSLYIPAAAFCDGDLPVLLARRFEFNDRLTVQVKNLHASQALKPSVSLRVRQIH